MKITWSLNELKKYSKISNKAAHILCLYFLAISFLEISAYKQQGIFSVIASRIWLFTGIFLITMFVCLSISIIIKDIKTRKFKCLFVYLLLFVFLYTMIGNLNYADINADAAQQTAAGITAMKSTDWNYTGTAFLGYPARQYIIAALPSLLLGRSIYAFHLGFAFPFLIGLTLIYFELRKWLENSGLKEEYALLPVYSIVAFRFIAEYYLNFEQAITPVALTMICSALLLKMIRQPDTITAIALSWCGCLCVDSYTPVLAYLGLLGCLILIYSIYLLKTNYSEIKTNHIHAKIFPVFKCFLGIEITFLFFFIATILGNRGDRITETRTDISISTFFLDTWKDFFTDKNAIFLGMFSGIILLYLLLAISFRLKFYDFIIACWTLMVVFLSQYMVGYTSYEKQWILQRNMIIIPVLVLAFSFATGRMLIQKQLIIENHTLIAGLLVLGLTSYWGFGQPHQSFTYFQYVQPMKYAISCTEDILKEKQCTVNAPFNLVLITDNALQSNIYDYASYFFPNAAALSSSTEEINPSIFQELDLNELTIVISENKETIENYCSDIKEQIYSDSRYHEEITWYWSII